MTWGARPWFVEDPDRYEWELASLRGKGFEPEVDEGQLRLGRLVIRGDFDGGDGTRRLVLVFPDTYPDHRVELYDQTGDEILLLHQHPVTGKLCLLDNMPEAWRPNEDSAAFMLERVEELRAANQSGRAGLEAIGVGAPEPRETYFPYELNSLVLLPEALLDRGEAVAGTFKFKLEAEGTVFRGALVEIHAGSSLTKAPADFVRLFTGPVLSGTWYRLSEPPPVLSATELHEWALDKLPKLANRLKGDPGNKVYEGGRFSKLQRLWAYSLVYPDDGPDGPCDAYLVCVLSREGKRYAVHLLRPFILARSEQERRIRSIAGLREKRIAIVGLGTLGAPIALELVRTGMLGEVHLVDSDYFSVWNLVRHPLNLRALGWHKALALEQHIRLLDPFVKITWSHRRIGETFVPASDDGPLLDLELARELSGFDLVVDATGDWATASFLSRVSMAAGFPLVIPTVTEGAWGGEVIRIVPGRTGCYDCYRFWDEDGQMPRPSQEVGAEPIYTRGCGFPTFAGTGFDALSVAADAVRLCVQTLLGNGSGQYPDADYDVLVRDNRGAEGSSAPCYRVASLKKHPRCSLH